MLMPYLTGRREETWGDKSRCFMGNIVVME
jgi:hypothetical protein